MEKAQFIDCGGVILSLCRIIAVVLPRPDRPNKPLRVYVEGGTCHEMTGEDATFFLSALDAAACVNRRAAKKAATVAATAPPVSVEPQPAAPDPATQPRSSGGRKS